MIATAALALLAPLAASTGIDVAGRASVQVAIVRQAESVKIVPTGPVTLVLPDGKRRPLGWKGELRLTPREGGLKLEDLRLPSETRLVPPSAESIKVGADAHRGTLILRLDPGQTLTIVEEISLESYLEGVLPHEMDPDWPLEALKAQAVVARTFAYANMGKFRKDGFDLTSDTRSQVYRGTTGVNENVRSAVRQTRGEVLGWHDRLLPVYYHSCCGGRTEDLARVWGGDPENTPRPLRGVRDPWCRGTPNHEWTAYFSWPDLMSAIQEKVALPGPLTALKIAHRDLAGRVLSFVARAGRRSIDIRASELRGALGADELKSTKIVNMVVKKKGIEFIGAGSGHGVGLCQWGAKKQALKGRSYERILQFYFPGSVLSEVAD